MVGIGHLSPKYLGTVDGSFALDSAVRFDRAARQLYPRADDVDDVDIRSGLGWCKKLFWKNSRFGGSRSLTADRQTFRMVDGR
jgi:hypothetical protein